MISGREVCRRVRLSVACSWVKLWAGEGRRGEPVMQGTVSPLMRGTAICGEEALAFNAVRGEGFEDDSASCVVELGHGGMGACSSNVSA